MRSLAARPSSLPSRRRSSSTRIIRFPRPAPCASSCPRGLRRSSPQSPRRSAPLRRPARAPSSWSRPTPPLPGAGWREGSRRGESRPARACAPLCARPNRDAPCSSSWTASHRWQSSPPSGPRRADCPTAMSASSSATCHGGPRGGSPTSLRRGSRASTPPGPGPSMPSGGPTDCLRPLRSWSSCRTSAPPPRPVPPLSASFCAGGSAHAPRNSSRPSSRTARRTIPRSRPWLSSGRRFRSACRSRNAATPPGTPAETPWPCESSGPPRRRFFPIPASRFAPSGSSRGLRAWPRSFPPRPSRRPRSPSTPSCCADRPLWSPPCLPPTTCSTRCSAPTAWSARGLPWRPPARGSTRPCAPPAGPSRSSAASFPPTRRSASAA